MLHGLGTEENREWRLENAMLHLSYADIVACFRFSPEGCGEVGLVSLVGALFAHLLFMNRAEV